VLRFVCNTYWVNKDCKTEQNRTFIILLKHYTVYHNWWRKCRHNIYLALVWL